MNANYELVMKGFINNFFLSKALQRQKRYLQRGLYNPCYKNIRDFIFRIDKIVEYLEKFPPFGVVQCLFYDQILELVEFPIPREWQKELIIQRLDYATQGLTELVKLCERLKTSEENFQMDGEGNQKKTKNKQSSKSHQSAKSTQSKGSNQTAKPSE